MQNAPWLNTPDRDDARAILFKTATAWNPIPDEGQLAVDVFETKTHLVIQSTIAGVLPEDLEIMLQSDLLTIRGARHNHESKDAALYHHEECYWGRFSRSIILPVPVVGDEATSTLKHGVLTIRLPKANPKQTIKVSEEE